MIDMYLMKYTQEMFDAIPVVGGLKKCPTGDYSEIDKFPGLCVFKKDSLFGCGCNFGYGCYFADNCKFLDCCTFKSGCVFFKECKFGVECCFDTYCRFSNYCSFEHGCEFGNSCKFKNNCRFGNQCDFGSYCSFLIECNFGKWCDFGNSCKFEKYCICEFGYFKNIVSCNWFEEEHFPIYFFNLADGNIFVRCGAYTGTIYDWCNEVSDRYKNTNLESSNLALVMAVKERFKI